MPILNTKTMLHPSYRSLYKQITEDRLEIPIIQRSYSWEKEQIDELFSEMGQLLEKSQEANLNDSEINLAIGQGIFFKNNGGNTYIYDGQQRILTYILFAKALANRYLKSLSLTDDPQKIKDIKHKISTLNKACYVQVANDQQEPRVIVQKKDREAFDYILGLNLNYKNSNSLLLHAYKIINDYVNKNISEEIMDTFFTVLTNKVEMLILKANNDTEAESLFYTTNSTGKPLSISELLHARIHQIFFKISKSTVNKWDDLYQKLIKKVKNTAIIDSFLLYAVQVDNFTITSAKVFAFINLKLIVSNEGKTYLEKLIHRLELLYSLLYENNESFKAVNSIISMTAIKQVYPLFIALSERLDKDSEVAKRTIDILTYIILQNNVVRQSPGTTKHSLKDILDNIKSNNIDIFTNIPKVPNIQQKLTDLTIEYDNKTGKALLSLMHLHSNSSISSVVISNKDSELEHLVPQEYEKWVQESTTWKNEITDNRTRLIYSIGNFVIVSGKVNKGLSNNVWAIKKTYLISNPLVSGISAIINDQLLSKDVVTPEYIIERGNLVANVLVNGIFKPFAL